MSFNSKSIFEILCSLKQAGTNDTITLLRDAMKDDMFRRVLVAAYDPFRTYGVRNVSVPECVIGQGKNFDSETWEILDDLQDRCLTGKEATFTIKTYVSTLNWESRELFMRILLKDLRCGISDKTINKAVPGTIPVFECMLSHKYEEKHIKQWPVVVEEKYDGVRALLILRRNSTGTFVSRTGHEFPAAMWLAKLIGEKVADKLGTIFDHEIVVDGELVMDSGSFYDAGAIRGHAECREIRFRVFDVIPYCKLKDGKDETSMSTRSLTADLFVFTCHRSDLRLISHVSFTTGRLAHNHDEVMDYYNEIRSSGGEGVIVKDRSAPYVCKRSKAWLKIKDQQSVDLPVVGMEEGTGKYKGMLGKLVCVMAGVEIKPGTGFTDAQREEWYKNPEMVLGKIVEIEYHEKTPDGSLRHPRFIRIRDDKRLEDGPGV